MSPVKWGIMTAILVQRANPNSQRVTPNSQGVKTQFTVG